ncbi:hypothetical protein AMS68_003101 [Peltaster fructicola]|uniref:Uncharacterized protein n=1 Tax=Peltaster fructicola TaxID=286661 RepID=A0A6H0XS73_9PEZI|nr:hypothetical protein AMS68_003101 [Peltaster fructicola]
MAPLRRYLRITKYSVLEVRIYLEKPSDAPWLLRDQVLPRIFAEIRPQVLPKLREENENSKKKGSKRKKNKGIKDVVTQDDFEVVLFLTDSYTRHSLITKQKHFGKKHAIKSTGSKMTEWLGNTTDSAIDVDNAVPGLLHEDSEEMPKLTDLPELEVDETGKIGMTGNDDTLFVSSDDEETFATQKAAPRRQKLPTDEEEDNEIDDKKKLGLGTSYDGFSLYGKILCLIVKRKGQKKPAVADALPVGGSEMMESWVSTQANQQADLDDDV